MMKLKGRVIVVTGGTGVLGREFVRAICLEGGHAVVMGRSEEEGAQVMAEMEKTPGKAFFVLADVLDRNLLQEAAARIKDNYGAIHGLVNAAGGILPSGVVMPDQDVFAMDIDGMMATCHLNLWGTILPTLLLGPLMQKQDEGASIVNITSSNATRAITRVMGYNIGKAGVDCFTQWMAVELANRFGERIRVNAIRPGFFLTHQNRNLLQLPEGGYTERGAAVINQTPFKRFGKPEELGSALIWLLSTDSSFVTGSVVTIDGGFSAFGGV